MYREARYNISAALHSSRYHVSRHQPILARILDNKFFPFPIFSPLPPGSRRPQNSFHSQNFIASGAPSGVFHSSRGGYGDLSNTRRRANVEAFGISSVLMAS